MHLLLPRLLERLQSPTTSLFLPPGLSSELKPPSYPGQQNNLRLRPLGRVRTVIDQWKMSFKSKVESRQYSTQRLHTVKNPFNHQFIRGWAERDLFEQHRRRSTNSPVCLESLLSSSVSRLVGEVARFVSARFIVIVQGSLVYSCQCGLVWDWTRGPLWSSWRCGTRG